MFSNLCNAGGGRQRVEVAKNRKGSEEGRDWVPFDPAHWIVVVYTSEHDSISSIHNES